MTNLLTIVAPKAILMQSADCKGIGNRRRGYGFLVIYLLRLSARLSNSLSIAIGRLEVEYRGRYGWRIDGYTRV